MIKKPIFIIGCCNSGTTILWRALLSHGSFCGPDIESQDLENLPRKLKHYIGKATFRLWAHPKFKMAYYFTQDSASEDDKQKVVKVFNGYNIEGKRFIAKSPADTLRARLIQAYFPDAYFIAIIRNGYAVSEGIVRKRMNDPDRPKYKGLFTSIDEAAEQWFRANVVILSHQNFLKKLLIIKYEDLVVDTKDTFNKIFDFCEMSIKFNKIPIFDTNNNSEQIARLNDYEKETITRIAMPMLIHYDYKIL